MKLPSVGLNREAVLAELEAYQENDLKWRDGESFAYVYSPSREADEVGKQAYMTYLTKNGLDPTVFPSLLRLETELVSMAAAHLHGDDEVVGSFTSGGTESIMLAVKTARDYAREKRPEITQPELLMPTTGHAAFHKSAQYLGLKVVLVDVDSKTFKPDVGALEDAITPNTVLLVGSSPSYAHGVIDPIEEMGQLAEKHGLLFHVDACVGGWLLPFFKRVGAPTPNFDFSVPGVTSISVDLHKYAFAPKGASIVLYRNKALRLYQMFACAEWTGYSVINPTVQSSKSGGPVAAAWAVVNFIGDDGYLDLAERMWAAHCELVDGLNAIDGLEVLGQPEFCMAGATSKEVSVFHVYDEMKERGWYVQPQLGFRNSPENLHFSILPQNCHRVGDMLRDLRGAVEAARSMPFGQLAATLGDALSSVDTSTLTDEMFDQMLAMAGMGGIEIPEKMADINELLNALPKDLCEVLLKRFVNDLYR